MTKEQINLYILIGFGIILLTIAIVAIYFVATELGKRTKEVNFTLPDIEETEEIKIKDVGNRKIQAINEEKIIDKLLGDTENSEDNFLDLLDDTDKMAKAKVKKVVQMPSAVYNEHIEEIKQKKKVLNEDEFDLLMRELDTDD